MAKISKILYIVTQSDFGGAQRYVFDLATNLPTDKFEVAVAAGGDGLLFKKLAEKGITTYKISNLVRPISPLKDLLAIFQLIKLFLKFRPDIIHLNSSKVSIVGSLASAIYRLKKNHKLIYTVHGFVFNEPLGQKIKTLYCWLERFCALFKDKLICIYQADMDQAIIKKIAPARKFTVVYNGINKINYLERSPARNALGIPDDKIIIGNIANFYPTKGLIYLVRAAKLVCEKIPNALFVLIGEGEERKNIEKEIKIQDLKEKFLLLGAKPGASIYFKAFDIFALSSLKEGLPYSLLEAMQAGLPCVATKVGGNMEIINDKQNGLLVDAADPELLANAINLLIANEELAKNLSQKAQSTISGKFSLNKMIENTINNY